jgi:PHD/YefM family antitoxin component YafN of YafNO toxin-antitoxin module
MATVTMADLGRHTRQALELAQTDPVLVLNNGKPTGVILGVDGLGAAEAERVGRRVMAERAAAAIQADAVQRGLDALSLDEINAVIAEARGEARARSN